MKKEEVFKKTISREKLLHITDLNVEKITDMTDEQLQIYTESLKSAVNIFPVQKEKLETSLQAMDYAPVIQWLKAIRNSISRIHADSLVKDCDKQLKLNSDLNNIRHESLRAFVDYFLATSSMLFSDIQQMLEELEREGLEHKLESVADKTKEKLGTITELDHGKIEQMTEEEFNSYVETLNLFEEDFPAQENGLRSALKTRNYASAIQWLTTIAETLAQIHADSLADDCQNQIKLNQDLDRIRHEKFEVFINYFLTSLSMLASDIRALHLPKQKQEKPTSVAADVEIAVEHMRSSIKAGAKSILAVNKMKIFLKNLKVILEGTDHSLVGVTSIESLFGYLKTAKPDLFIIDDDFPDMDGCDLAEKIREMGQVAPIIFLTGNITKDYMVRAIAAGVADFIIKPIAAKDVQEKVAAHLSDKS